MAETLKWISMENGPTGVGGQVWVAYRSPKNPDGWNLRIQWTPIQKELLPEPEFWMPVAHPTSLPPLE